jgi:hypothetical protein
VLQIVDIWGVAQIKLNVPVIVNVLMRRVPVIAIATALQQIVETILNVNVIVILMIVIAIWFQIVRQYRQDRWAKIVFVIREVIVHVLVNVILRVQAAAAAAVVIVIKVDMKKLPMMLMRGHYIIVDINKVMINIVVILILAAVIETIIKIKDGA